MKKKKKQKSLWQNGQATHLTMHLISLLAHRVLLLHYSICVLHYFMLPCFRFWSFSFSLPPSSSSSSSLLCSFSVVFCLLFFIQLNVLVLIRFNFKLHANVCVCEFPLYGPIFTMLPINCMQCCCWSVFLCSFSLVISWKWQTVKKDRRLQLCNLMCALVPSLHLFLIFLVKKVRSKIVTTLYLHWLAKLADCARWTLSICPLAIWI